MTHELNFIPVSPDETDTYEAVQILSVEDLLAVRNPAPELEGNLRAVYPSYEKYWLIRNTQTGREFFVSEVDFAADWSKVEVDPLAELAKELDFPGLSDGMKARGEFTTEEVWQCYEEFPQSTGDKGWWDAVDEDNARERSARAGYPDKVRVKTITTVVGPWRNA